MLEAIEATLDPSRYHGRGGGRPFFEGWYYKLVDRERHRRLAVIPGIFHGREPAQDHAFVQVLDGTSGRAQYHTFPADAFRAARDRFSIAVGPNRFTADRIDLDLDSGEGRVKGSLSFHGRVPWPSSLLSPGVMGWYAWVPFMECYHGVVSLDHAIQGTLAVDGALVDFTSGRGYTEKDWGRSFPAAWVWCQTNHFAEQGTSLTASVAVVPWLRGSFAGFIAGLWHDGKLYRFASYTGAHLEQLVVTDRDVDWVLADSRFRLRLHLERGEGGLLHGPTTVDMERRVAESLTAVAQVELATAGAGGHVLFSGTGHEGGLEVNGDLPLLLRMSKPGRRRGA